MRRQVFLEETFPEEMLLDSIDTNTLGQSTGLAVCLRFVAGLRETSLIQAPDMILVSSVL